MNVNPEAVADAILAGMYRHVFPTLSIRYLGAHIEVHDPDLVYDATSEASPDRVSGKAAVYGPAVEVYDDDTNRYGVGLLRDGYSRDELIAAIKYATGRAADKPYG